MAAADRKIMQPNGCEMEILVDDREPYFCLNDNLKEKMADAMDTRYNAATKSMDLTKFYAHEQLRNNYCPLNRTSIMDAAIEIIASRVLDVEVLILNNNKIRYMRSTEMLGTYLPRLKSLFLANNMVSSKQSEERQWFSWIKLKFYFSLPTSNHCNWSTKRKLLKFRWQEIQFGKSTTRMLFISGATFEIKLKLVSIQFVSLFFSEIRRRFPKLRKVVRIFVIF